MKNVQTLGTRIPFLYKAPKGKIDPKSLGYICPNGQIKFQDAENALKYTKNTILDALKKGKERAVFTKDSLVLQIVDGSQSRVEGDFIDIPNVNGFVIYHGHPESAKFITETFSRNDVKTFMMFNQIFGCEKSVVYNSLGEECIMTAPKSLLSRLKLSPINKLLLYKYNPMTWIRHNQIDKISKKFNKKMDLNKYLDSLTKFMSKEEIAFVKQLQENNPKELQKWLRYKMSTIVANDCLKEYTSKLGINFKTNFSNLKAK